MTSENNKKNALFLINLGTPKSTDPNDVGVYLTEFLTDKNVIDIPAILRHILVRLIIVPKRKKESAEKYKKVWTNEGSPLLVYTEKLIFKLKDTLKDVINVSFAMRYGVPSIKDRLQEIKDFDTIYTLPLYPHDTKSSVMTAVEKVYKEADKLGIKHKIQILPPFYEENYFNNALTELIQRKVKNKQVDHYLFSYHGIPQKHLPKKCEECVTPCHNVVDIKDCYRAQCYRTSNIIAEKLGLTKEQYTTAFQSRLGKSPWIKPYSDLIIEELRTKYKNLVAITPSFVSDCLETIEEVGIEFEEIFTQNCKEHNFIRVPCLNDDDNFIQYFSDYVRSEVSL